MGAASHAGRDKVEAVGGKRAEQKVQVAGRAARALAYLVEQIRTNLLEALVICDVGACISRRRDRLAIQRYLDLDFSRGVRRLRAAAGTAADVSVREEPVTNEGVIRSAVWLELGVLMVALRTVSPKAICVKRNDMNSQLAHKKPASVRLIKRTQKSRKCLACFVIRRACGAGRR